MRTLWDLHSKTTESHSRSLSQAVQSDKAVAVVDTTKSCLDGFSSLGKSPGLILPISAIGRG